MSLREPSFLLDIQVELSYAFTDGYEIEANSENLFDVHLINITNNNNKGCKNIKITRTSQRRTKKKNPLRDRCGYKQYGRSVFLTKTSTDIISNMKIHCLELYLQSKTYTDGRNGIVYIPWTKSFIKYLKNITQNPRLPPVAHKENLNVMNEKTHLSLGSLNVTVKLMSLSSNFYKFITSSKNNVRIYRNMFSSFNVLTKLKWKPLSDHKHATEKSCPPVLNPCNKRSDATYIKEYTENNLPHTANNTQIENTREGINILGNSPTNPNIHNTTKSRYKLGSFEASNSDRTFCTNYVTCIKDNEKYLAQQLSEKTKSPMKTITSLKDGHQPTTIVLPVVNLTKHSCNSKPDISQTVVTSCNNIACDREMRSRKLPNYHNSLALDLSTLQKQCCSRYEQESDNFKFDEHPCYCTCECTFEIIRETAYCKICGGYEVIGEEFDNTRGQEMPMPCPIFHKLVEKNKLKSRSSSGSIRRRKADESSRSIKSSKSTKSTTPQQSAKTSEKRLKVPEKKVVQPKRKRELKKKKIVKLKEIDYSYKTPHVGHDDCIYPCTRSAVLKCNVPKDMGWFWTADNVQGLKYRPTWRPGAAEKHVVHLLQMARQYEQVMSKKKNKEVAKAKRPLKRPLLVVHKKEGEFTVTMETMKASMKPREVYEHPYEDKPVLTYTIGRTDEENKERVKQKLRKQRRLEREQRSYIQGAFKNMCEEICLKTCQQALGILPEAEDKQGLCYANATLVESENPNPSCACSENSLSISDTDSDEWIVEFTPPNAFFDPSRKGKKIIKTEKDTQYILSQS